MTTSGGRRALTGAKVLAAALAAIGLAQCDREPQPDTPETPPAPIVPAPPAPLGRAEVLTALEVAASSFAAEGRVDPLVLPTGRPLQIALPFACPGVSDTAQPGVPQLTLSDDSRSAVLSITPADWTRSAQILAPGAEPAWSRADGFWIARPWISAPSCPRVTGPAETARPIEPSSSAETKGEAPAAPSAPAVRLPAPASSPMTAGLVMLEAPEASRLGRRPGEAWRFTVRGAGEAPFAAPAEGYRLVLSGRVGRFPDGASIRCSAPGPQVRPLCVAAVELDRVAFQAAGGAQLSEWRLD